MSTAALVDEVWNAANRREAADVYARALREPNGIDWATLNAAILTRWSHAGLRFVKQLAWSLSEEPAS